MNTNERSLKMAKRLKYLRNLHGLSFDSLSKKIAEKYDVNISVSSLKNYEVSEENHSKAFNNKGMRAEFIWYLADFYGVPSDYILAIPENDTVGQRDENSVVQIKEYDRCEDYINLDITHEACEVIENLCFQQKEALERILSHKDLSRMLAYIGLYYAAEKKDRDPTGHTCYDVESIIDMLQWNDVSIPCPCRQGY